jgi:hypothetical protein
MTTMLSKSAFLAALGVMGAAFAADTTGAMAGDGLSCEIKVVKSGGDVELKGIVHASRAMSGTYKFKISQSGGGGSADINQGGDFDLAAGESQVVGEATLGDADGLRAKLSVSAGADTTYCTRGS